MTPTVIRGESNAVKHLPSLTVERVVGVLCFAVQDDDWLVSTEPTDTPATARLSKHVTGKQQYTEDDYV